MHMSPSEVDEAWQALLQETLSEDKQEALMESYEQEKDPSMRYNMLLEFSSYLRQVRIRRAWHALHCNAVMHFDLCLDPCAPTVAGRA